MKKNRRAMPKGRSMTKSISRARAKASRLRMTGRRARAMASMAKGMTTTIVATSMAMIGMRAREIPQPRAETIGNI